MVYRRNDIIKIKFNNPYRNLHIGNYKTNKFFIPAANIRYDYSCCNASFPK